MTIDGMVSRLEVWKEKHTKLMAQQKALAALTGADLDCALMRPVVDLWIGYTQAVSELIGDTAEWLSWYECECDMGNKTREVIGVDGKRMQVRSLRDLARVIKY